MTSQSVWPSWENQVGLFLKIPSDNFSFQSCPNIWWLFGALSRSHYLSSFWGVIGLLFIPSSGHTGDCHEPQQIPSQLKQNDVIYYTWQKMLQPQQIPSQPKQNNVIYYTWQKMLQPQQMSYPKRRRDPAWFELNTLDWPLTTVPTNNRLSLLWQ